MREILFRGKPVERFLTQMQITNQWDENGFVYGSLIVSEDRCYICTYAECTMNTIIGNGHATMVEVIPETVGQFTGMADNGVKIFEGDIVKTHYANTKKNDFVEQIVFQNGKFCSMFELSGGGKMFANLADGIPHLPQDKSVYMEWCEIIGNIHDNPELLKGEEK